jgi:hypothetical protein
MKRLVEPKRVTHPHHDDARCAAQISKHLAYELIELVLIDRY